MGNRNVWRLLQIALIAGEEADMAAGETMAIVPIVDDQGKMTIGNGTKDMDFVVYLGGAGNYVWFDSGASQLILSGVALVGGGAVVTESGTSRTGTTADYGKTIYLTNASACTYTLPAPTQVGAEIVVVCSTDAAHIVALDDSIIALTSLVADSMTAAEVSKVGQAITLKALGAKWLVRSHTGAWTVTAA